MPTPTPLSYVVSDARKAAYVSASRSREKSIPVAMEGDGHDTVGVVEELLDTVSVVDIDVNVHDAAMAATS